MSYRVVYGETMLKTMSPRFSHLSANFSAFSLDPKVCSHAGIHPVVPGQGPRSLTAALLAGVEP